jgi:hypothetical protein
MYALYICNININVLYKTSVISFSARSHENWDRKPQTVRQSIGFMTLYQFLSNKMKSLTGKEEVATYFNV